jgi:hypothetical protein
MFLRCVQVPLIAVLPTAQAAMDAHRGVVAVAEHVLYFLRNLSLAKANRVREACCRLGASLFALCNTLVMLVCCLQVPLMTTLPAAQAVMGAHRGVVAVAEHGMYFLANLGTAEANQVNRA